MNERMTYGEDTTFDSTSYKPPFFKGLIEKP